MKKYILSVHFKNGKVIKFKCNYYEIKDTSKWTAEGVNLEAMVCGKDEVLAIVVKKTFLYSLFKW